jgi:hypothetical protein
VTRLEAVNVQVVAMVSRRSVAMTLSEALILLPAASPTATRIE